MQTQFCSLFTSSIGFLFQNTVQKCIFQNMNYHQKRSDGGVIKPRPASMHYSLLELIQPLTNLLLMDQNWCLQLPSVS